jgi:hypothetical protein
MKAVEALFRKVFHCRDGHRVIGVLRELVDTHPKTEMEYARVVGMHSIIDSIVHYAGIFREDEFRGE